MILVFGSFMMDCVTTCTKAPVKGETVKGLSYERFLGGKGINQAVAARRLKSDVEIIGVLGKDSFADEFKSMMKEEGLLFNQVNQIDVSTGIGSIVIEEDGQNRIIIVPGANLFYDKEELSEVIPSIINADICVTQLENNLDATFRFLDLCKKLNKKIILNPAPAICIDKNVLNGITVLTPNETELAVLVQRELHTLEDYISACKELLSYGVENIVATLGSQGALLCNKDVCKIVRGYKVKAIDTVAAGDSFNGALANCLERNICLEDAVEFANAVGALTVQKKGAIPSLPKYDDVIKFIGENNVTTGSN